MNTFLDQAAFSVGEQSYTWRDVVLAAILRGEWSSLEEQTRQGLALVGRAEATERPPAEEEIEAAAEEFRYERDLVTAEEMEAWLAGFGLTVEEWMDAMERSLLRRTRAGEVEEALASYDPDDEEFEESIVAEAICSGALAAFAERLAARAAIGEQFAGENRKENESPSSDPKSALRASSEAFARAGLAPPKREEVERMELIERAFGFASAKLVTPAAIRAQIEANRLDWIRLDLRALTFENEAAAREAFLCLREDGEPLEQVAREAHVPIEDAHIYVADIDAAAQPALLCAAPGDLIGPLAVGEQFRLFQLRGKSTPSEEDAQVWRLAQERCLAKLTEQEVASRVRWHGRI